MNTVACTALMAMAMGHPGHSEPKRDAGRLQRHAQQLSEACLRRGHSLQSGGCPLDEEAIAGPYVWDTNIIRRNITEGYPGVPLQLSITVVNSANCEPVQNAATEIWLADATGVYSHFLAALPEDATATEANSVTDNSTFLRGIQPTDGNGTVVFDTIFPGWYLGRTMHIHVRVRTGMTELAGGYTGGVVQHVGQLYFPQAVMDAIAAVSPYKEDDIERETLALDFLAENGRYGLITVFPMDLGKGVAGGAFGSVTLGVALKDAGDTAAGDTAAGDTASAFGPSVFLMALVLCGLL